MAMQPRYGRGRMPMPDLDPAKRRPLFDVDSPVHYIATSLDAIAQYPRVARAGDTACVRGVFYHAFALSDAGGPVRWLLTPQPSIPYVSNVVRIGA